MYIYAQKTMASSLKALQDLTPKSLDLRVLEKYGQIPVSIHGTHESMVSFREPKPSRASPRGSTASENKHVTFSDFTSASSHGRKKKTVYTHGLSSISQRYRPVFYVKDEYPSLVPNLPEGVKYARDQSKMMITTGLGSESPRGKGRPADRRAGKPHTHGTSCLCNECGNLVQNPAFFIQKQKTFLLPKVALDKETSLLSNLQTRVTRTTNYSAGPGTAHSTRVLPPAHRTKLAAITEETRPAEGSEAGKMARSLSPATASEGARSEKGSYTSLKRHAVVEKSRMQFALQRVYTIPSLGSATSREASEVLISTERAPNTATPQTRLTIRTLPKLAPSLKNDPVGVLTIGNPAKDSISIDRRLNKSRLTDLYNRGIFNRYTPGSNVIHITSGLNKSSHSMTVPPPSYSNTEISLDLGQPRVQEDKSISKIEIRLKSKQ